MKGDHVNTNYKMDQMLDVYATAISRVLAIARIPGNGAEYISNTGWQTEDVEIQFTCDALSMSQFSIFI